ncbi:MAG: alpha/beta fold hydrolase [Desulfobacterota bacterium]|nr:alpha/beta fold hydrolase [Thermodesulfobacteriota bacterium]MDW8001767.1 alpha/beta fold hydrolase [Deltaproteobacteria bacterium]
MEKLFEIESTYNRIRGIITYPHQDEGVFPCVILSHGLLSSKNSIKYVEASERLKDYGLISVRFDYHGCGESGGKIEETSLTKRIENLKKVLDFAVSDPKVDKKRIGILGSSFGGTTALVLASKDKRIKVLALLATPYKLGEKTSEVSKVQFHDSFFQDFSKYDILSSAGSVSFCLLVHGQKDETVPVEQAETIFERLRPPKKLEIIEGADHTFSDPNHRKMVIDLTCQWFQEHLL